VKGRGTIAVTTENDLVHLVVTAGGRPVTVILPADQARELSRMIRNAADFADAATMGTPQGTA